jgi:hypothetical protein
MARAVVWFVRRQLARRLRGRCILIDAHTACPGVSAPTRIEPEETMETSKSHYGRLLAMAVLSFLCMYALMYAMVDTFANVYRTSISSTWRA